jgi:hypothetical protein
MARPLSVNPASLRHANHTNGSGLADELDLAPAGSDDLAPALPGWDAEGAAPPAEDSARELAALRQQLAEAERLLTDLKQEAEQTLLEQQTEFERILEEKSELIRSLHRKLQEHQERPAAAGAAAPREEELMALSEELERERHQLKEDEESLMEQMGQMEVQMSRERAELARQRSELQRLQNEIRHELELAARDAALRERLAPLQRRHQEMNSGRASAPPEAPAPANGAAADASRQAGKGVLRRLFG